MAATHGHAPNRNRPPSTAPAAFIAYKTGTTTNKFQPMYQATTRACDMPERAIH
jgi:hypothetical protein